MRILVISDIHANLVALKAVLKAAGSFDRIWCLGDVVGYGPEPNACIEMLKQHPLVCLAGNHDWAALNKLDLDEFNADARAAVLITQRDLTASSVAWLQTLPERVPVELDRYTLVHGSPRHPIWEYVLTPTIAHLNFGEFETLVCLMGHSHVPMIFRLDAAKDRAFAEPLFEDESVALDSDRRMINPGSVGQPRDGDPRAAFAILDTEASTLIHHRVAYDVSATQKRMEEIGMPLRLIHRLSVGA